MPYDLNVQKIVNVRYEESRSWKRPRALPRHWEALVLFCKGEVEYRFAQQTLTVKEGDLFLLPGALAYSGVRLTEEVSFFVIDFTCVAKDETTRFGAPRILVRNGLASLYPVFCDFLSLWKRRPIETELRAKALLYRLLCAEFLERDDEKKEDATARILDYIQKELGNDTLSVASLCQRFFISESQLRRNLRKATGLSPNRYVLTLRLNRAVSELLNTEKSVQQISYECGFASPYYFSRCFTEAYGLSPRAYRNTYESV